MGIQRRECPKCRGPMDEGFMLDHTHGGYETPTFVLGQLRKRWWGIQTKGQTKFSVITFRCSRCGFLESHANAERK
jgi:ribosomal protein S27AE